MHESRPEAAHEDLAGGSITNNGTHDNARRVTFTGEQIDSLLWALIAGEIHPGTVSSVLLSWYHAGHRDGRASREGEVRQAKWEADRLWLLTFAPADRRTYLLERLDRFASIAYDEGEIDRHLEESFARWCASLDDVREATA